MGTSDAPVSRREFVSSVVGAGTLAATADTASAQPEPTDTPATDTGTTTDETTDGADVTVTPAGEFVIDMTDDLVFDPDDTTIAPGTTVIWENVGTIGHSVTAYEDQIPADAEYFASGGFDAEQAARQSYSAGDPDAGDVVGGESYEHTFTVEGEYEYFCVPHEATGMVASLTVSTDTGGDGDGEDEGPGPLPGSAVFLGVVALATIVAVVSLSWFFLKYGGDYGEN
ncbi:plastocyanin/azurin family copper-binding protein [Salinibaculum salinum]|uniref:plastocyanin/azurin family copper-binding protein n=1 Tax=Salinibaculum salinum TaxID=3131996 RepID=UPI0030EC744C